MLSRAFAVTLSFSLFAPIAEAQQYTATLPSNFDFSGIWVVDGVPVPTGEQPRDRCDRLWRAESNWPLFGRTWVELRATSVEYTPVVSDLGPRLRVYHEGTLHFFQGYGFEEYTKTGITVDYYCHLEQIDYAVTGYFEWFLDFEIDPPYTFNLAATEIGTSPYRHSADGAVSFSLFLDQDGQLAMGGVGVSDNFVNNGSLPDGCNLMLRQPAEQFSLSQCRPTSGYPMILRRSEAAPNVSPRANISGTIAEGLPDGTDTGEVLTEARVRLLRQAEAVRPQRGNETMVDYDRYLAELRARRQLVAEARPDASGRFVLPDIEVLEKIPDGRQNGFRRALYTLEVTGAEKDEVDPQTQERSTIYFLAKELEGIVPGADERVVLIPASDLNTKISLTDRLLALAPNQYGPIEEQVKAYLTQLLTNTIPLTPERNEGVRRAVWSERSVAIGAEFANELTQLMMENLADWLVDLFGDPVSTKSGKIKDAEERLANLKSAQDFAAAEGKGLAAFTPFSNAAGVQQLTGAMDKLMEETPFLRDGQKWDMVKKIFKWGLFYPMKNGLISFGLHPESVDSLLAVMEQGIFAVLDSIIQGERGDVYKAIIKAAIGRLQGTVFDSSIDLIPSYAQQTKGALAASRDAMQSWASVDDTIYQQDRAICVDHIQTMANEATNILRATYYAKGIAEGLGDGADVLSMIPNPATQSAAKLAKFAKNVAAIDAFVSPGVYTFARLSGHSDLAAYAAFGQVPPATLTTLPVLAARTAPNPRIHQLFSEAGRAVELELEAIHQSLEFGNYPDAILRTTAESPQGLSSSIARLERGFDWLMLVAASSATDSPEVDGGVRLGGPRYLELRAEIAVLMTDLRSLYLDLMEGRDLAALTTRVANIGSRIRAIKNRRQLAELAFNPLFSALNTIQVVPVVGFEDVRLESASSGRAAITQTPEVFTLNARVHNLSTAALSGISARVRAFTPSGTATVTSARVVTIGALAADDGMDGIGPDETSVSFSFTYGGPIETLETVAIEVTLLENGSAPITFTGETRSELLTIAPELRDPDADGIPTPTELLYGLDPAVDDAALDSDADGLANGLELRYGARPDQSDTDGDGLSDGEEVYGGTDGWITDPTRADTDGDGALDPDDGAPVDGTSSTVIAPPEEPVVSVSASEIILGEEDDRTGSIMVTNAGGGSLSWSVAVPESSPLFVTPRAPTLIRGDGRISVMLPPSIREIGAELDGLGVPLRVVDLSGATPDEQTVVVWIGRRGTLADGGVSGDGGSGSDAGASDGAASNDGSTREDASASRSDAGPSEPESEGCGCSSVDHPGRRNALSPLILLALLGLGLRRRAQPATAPN